MALSIVKRPQGYVLDTTQITGVTVTSSPPDAYFNKSSHGLITGDFIYMYSTYSSFNGFWYVEKDDNNHFFLKEYATANRLSASGSTVDTINSGTIFYYKSVLTHNWNCVHLPIVYKLKSDIWPTNTSDTARTITTFSNYNGYTYINASGDIKTTGTASALEQVILSGTSVDGIYKIIQWFSDTNFVINLSYSAGNVLSSGTVQYYYFNYNARIRIYAGISPFLLWNTVKPYELMTELRMIPDSNGVITLNISEFIKSKIKIISNNSILNTLPNNIDAWCNFYISYAESYDDSNMYTLSEYVSSYTLDYPGFEGYALNSKLPFKTQSQGSLNKYVSGLTSTTLQKWLTDFTRPTLFAGKYFDVSYIKNDNTSNYIKRDLYRLSGGNYSLITSIRDNETNNFQGVYRYSITQSVNLEDRIDITYYAPSSQVFIAPSSWSDFSGFFDAYGSKTATKLIKNSITVDCGAFQPVSLKSGIIPNNITLHIKITGMSSFFMQISCIYYDHNFPGSSAVSSKVVQINSNTDADYGFSFPALSADATIFGIISHYVGPDTPNIEITVPVGQSIYDIQLSETKTIDVNQKCSFTDFYLVWLNHLGGYDYWNFNAKRGKKYSIDILESQTQEQNIFNNWPNSYGEFADSILKQTVRRSKNRIMVSSQLLTSAQEDAIKLITSSPLVQLCTSQYDRQTMIVNPDSLNVRQDKDKSLSITFTVTYTDEIPVQQL